MVRRVDEIDAISCLFQALDFAEIIRNKELPVPSVAKVLLPFCAEEFKAILGDRYLQGGKEPTGLFILCYNEVTEC